MIQLFAFYGGLALRNIGAGSEYLKPFQKLVSMVEPGSIWSSLYAKDKNPSAKWPLIKDAMEFSAAAHFKEGVGRHQKVMLRESLRAWNALMANFKSSMRYEDWELNAVHSRYFLGQYKAAFNRYSMLVSRSSNEGRSLKLRFFSFCCCRKVATQSKRN